MTDRTVPADPREALARALENAEHAGRDRHDLAGAYNILSEAVEHAIRALAARQDEPSPDPRLIDERPKLGDLAETIELEVGLHNPVGPNYECDCGDQLRGETYNHHLAGAIDYRLTATDGDA